MNLVNSQLQNIVLEFSRASSEYEVCEILAHCMDSLNLTQSYALYLNDSLENAQCVLQSDSESTLQDSITIPIMHLEVKHGYIAYSPTSKENQDVMHLLAQMAGIACSAIMNSQDARIQQKMLGKTSLVLDTVLEMLSDIILQSDKKSIANISAQFLMGQLRIGTYAIIGYSSDQHYEILSFNGFEESTLLLMLNDISNEQDFANYDVIAMPMEHGSAMKGYILLPNNDSRKYSGDDLAFVSMLGMITALSIERTVLFEEEARLLVIEKDLALAKTIQQQLLPSFLEIIPGIEISGAHIPSREIGGDYVDILHYSDGSLLLIVADVSGKGISAALIMTMVKSACTLLVKQSKNPKEIIESLNELVFYHTTSDTFVTCACVYVNTNRTLMTCINAGHEIPLLKKSNGEIIELHAGCIVLGVMQSITDILQSEHNIESGDMICMYTDGICDSSFAEGNLPIISILSECNNISHDTATQFMDQISRSMDKIKGIAPEDDASMLLLRFAS